MTSRPVIFVSCGQVTDDERKLGKDVCDLIKQLAPFEPYFAENQATLEGVSENILRAINGSAGMIAIMHPRGRVSLPRGSTHTRASVWIEQEIAIAAFLTQVCNRRFPILAYIHKNIKREGLRDKLLLNAQPFESSDEILKHLRAVLPTWAVDAPGAPPPVEVSITYEKRMCDRERHNYRLTVHLKNTGTAVVNSYHLDVLFPTGLLPPGVPRPLELRSTAEGSLFRVSTREHQANALYPDDPPSPALHIDYYVDKDIFQNQQELLQQKVVAKFYVNGSSPVTTEKNISDLQNF